MDFFTYKMKDLGDVYSGGTPSTKNNDYWDGDIAWITPKDLSGYCKKYIFYGERNISELGLKNSSANIIPKNSVLMSSRAPIGYVVINKISVSTNQGFKSISCDESKCLNEYMYYWIKNNIKYIISKANGSTFKEISGTSFKELDVDIPTLDNQKKIVNILGKLDNKIELNNQINNNLSYVT
jgi:type I restriction enzyme S subunit